MLARLVDGTDFRLSRNGVARIEPVDAATWMRVGVRLCALEYRLERQAKCGKQRDVATVGWLPSDVEYRRLRQLLLHVRAVSMRAQDCCMRECRWV